jgi:dTDP-glucose 4,6-dehydratase
VRAWWHTYGFPAFVSNTTNNYGPWQFPEKLIPLVALNALEGRTLPVYGDGSNIRDWLHVDDHAEALCLAALGAGRPGGTYCIGPRQERTNLEVVRAICAVLDRLRPDPAGPRERLISFVRDRPGHDFRYAMDPSGAEAALGWRARHDFEGGLEATLRWYLDHEAWWGPIRARRYAGQRLGQAPTETGAAAASG